ncbi:MAG: hypothetical protein IJ859_04460 [Synergistaceae bacterium]|nr:hypothetical protein [Synergistaceae bacterium]
MKKICFSLIILLTFCGAASAHIIYTTEAGSLGLISVSNETSSELSGIEYNGGNGSVVASYWENNTSNGAGNSKIILITPTEDTTLSGDTAVRFSSSETLSSPIDDDPIVLEGSYGTPIICGTNSGGSLYLATGASLREYKTSDFRFYNTYTYLSDDLVPSPEIKAVTKNDSRVYVLVALNNNISNDIVVTLDGTLNPKSEYSGKWEVSTSKNTYTMNFISDSRIVVGADDGVYRVTNALTASLVSSDYPVVAIQKDTGKGFYYITQSETEGGKTNSLYHYTTTDTNPSALLTATGDGAQLVKDSKYNVLGVMIGEQITLVNMEDDSFIQTYSSTNLSGKPISIAASSTSGNSADTSSGCMIGGAGLAMMAALLASLKYKRA